MTNTLTVTDVPTEVMRLLPSQLTFSQMCEICTHIYLGIPPGTFKCHDSIDRCQATDCQWLMTFREMCHFNKCHHYDVKKKKEEIPFSFFEEIYRQIPDVIKNGTQPIRCYTVFGVTKTGHPLEIRVPCEIYESWDDYH